MSLARPRAVFLDLEGTLRWGGMLILGAAEAVRSLRGMGLTLRFLTNIDSKRPERIASGLGRAGLEVEPGEVFTPMVALQRFLEADPSRRCYFLLSEELRGCFAEYAVAEPPEAVPRTAAAPGVAADYVVVGDFRDSLSFERLNRAYRHLLGGARLMALQGQAYFMGPDGPYLDTGAFVHMLEYVAGVQAAVLGKPDPDFFRIALRDVGLAAGEVVMVGDDLTTDIAGAAAVGMRTVLVRTGKFSAERLAASEVLPDHVVESAAALPALVESLITED